MNPGIAQIATYFPSKTLDNDELIERFGFKEEFLTEKIGVRKRPVAADDEGVSDMAASAASRLFEAGKASPDGVELLIVCTQNPDYKLPATANIVQEKAGLPMTIPAFDINQGCSGFITGLSVARSMMVTEGYETALLITSEAYSKVMDPSDRHTVPLFGDGAAATLLTDEGTGKIGRFVWGTDGAGAGHLIVRGGGGLHPKKPPEGEFALFMNGREIFNFMMRRVPRSVSDCLAANRLSMDEIDLFAFHQASRYMVQNLARHMEIPESKVPVFLEFTGNTVSSTIPALLEAEGGGEGLRGRRVLASGFGVGLSWGSTVLTFE